MTPPKSEGVRPTTDRVKEAIFSMLAPDLPDAVCLDLFAGSGGLGIEAISRGAARVYFCDLSPESIALVKKNVAAVRAEDRAVPLLCGWRQSFARIHEKIDIVLIDAPYDLCEYADILSAFAAAEILADGALIVIERERGKGRYALPIAFELLKTRHYGNTEVDVIRFEIISLEKI